MACFLTVRSFQVSTTHADSWVYYELVGSSVAWLSCFFFLFLFF